MINVISVDCNCSEKKICFKKDSFVLRQRSLFLSRKNWLTFKKKDSNLQKNYKKKIQAIQENNSVESLELV